MEEEAREGSDARDAAAGARHAHDRGQPELDSDADSASEWGSASPCALSAADGAEGASSSSLATRALASLDVLTRLKLRRFEARLAIADGDVDAAQRSFARQAPWETDRAPRIALHRFASPPSSPRPRVAPITRTAPSSPCSDETATSRLPPVRSPRESKLLAARVAPSVHSPRAAFPTVTNFRSFAIERACVVPSIAHLEVLHSMDDSGLSSMRSGTRRGLSEQEMKLAALQEEAFVAPGYTQPHAGTRTASITAHTTGTPVIAPPKHHSWDAVRLVDLLKPPGAPSPAAYRPQAPLPHVSSPRYGYRLSFFTHEALTRAMESKSLQEERRSMPGPGHYFRVPSYDIRLTGGAAPFQSKSARFSTTSRTAREMQRPLCDDQCVEKESARDRFSRASWRTLEGLDDIVRVAKRFLPVPRIAAHFETRLRSRGAGSHQATESTALLAAEREESLDMALLTASPEKRLRTETGRAQVAWLRLLAVCGFASRAYSSLLQARFLRRMEALRRERAAIAIQREFRRAQRAAEQMKRLRGFMQRFEPMLLLRARIQRKKRAGRLIAAFFLDTESLALRRRKAAPASVEEVVRRLLVTVCRIQRCWRRVLARRCAEQMLFLQYWTSVAHHPGSNGRIRATVASLPALQRRATRKRRGHALLANLGASEVAGGAGPAYVEGEAAAATAAAAAAAAVTAASPPQAAMVDTLGSDENEELVDLEVRTKLVKNKLRELRHRFLLRSREHAEALAVVEQAAASAPELEEDSARDFLVRGAAAEPLEARRRRVADEARRRFLARHPRPRFMPLRSCKPAEMLELVVRGLREQASILARRSTVHSGAARRDEPSDAGEARSGLGDAASAKRGAQIWGEIKKMFLHAERLRAGAVLRLLLMGEDLIDAGVIDLNAPISGTNSTCLHAAVWYRHVQVTKWLLAFGAEPNVQNLKGNSPVHYACQLLERENGQAVLRALCQAGADVFVRNGVDGVRPIDLSPRAVRQLVTTIALDREGQFLPPFTEANWRRQWRAILLEEETRASVAAHAEMRERAIGKK